MLFYQFGEFRNGEWIKLKQSAAGQLCPFKISEGKEGWLWVLLSKYRFLEQLPLGVAPSDTNNIETPK